MPTRQGKHTVKLDTPPSVVGYAALGSKRESEGPMAGYFDILNTDSMFGQETWEKAESRMQQEVAEKALHKAGLTPGAVDYVFAGDLLNQCIGSCFGLQSLEIPFLGLYGACSTMAEGLGLGALFVETGIARATMAVTSSHFCSAEKQYRFPLAYGGVRTPTSQWTVTGAGAAVMSAPTMPPYVKAVTFGIIEDKAIKDANNMGAAMAPAAAGTIQNFFQDTMTNEDNYDLIVTGDLALVGSDLLKQLLRREGYDLGSKHADCGLLIYDRDVQRVEAGGSGCGCSGAVVCSYIMQSLRAGKMQDVLFVGTGALMSPTSLQQGQSIAGIAHLVHLSATPN